MITFCDDKYKLIRRVGHGSFGAVFLTVKLNQNGQSMTSQEMGQTAAQVMQSTFIGEQQQQQGGVSAAPAGGANFFSNNNNNHYSINHLPGMVVSMDMNTNNMSPLGQIQTDQHQTHHHQSASPNSNQLLQNPNNDINNNINVIRRSPLSTPFANNNSFASIPPTESQYNIINNNQFGRSSIPLQQQPLQMQQQQQQAIQLQQHFITKLEGLPKNCTAANPGDSARSHLTREYRFYKYMHDCCENLVGIPQVYDFGVEGQYRYLVMDQCGPSLDALFRAKSKNFTPLTILRIAQQMISRIQFVHTLGLVHRDIKPENFCMGMHDKCHVLYLIDFGLAKMFLSKKNGEHVDIVTGKRLAGTARYASIWTHEGISQARRDDMEGIWFTLLYLARGGFPWDTGPSTQNIEQYIGSVKKKVPPDQLCKNVPEPLKNFMLSFISHVRSLDFAQEPDYFKLKQMCIAALHQLGTSETLESLSDYCWFKSSSDAATADNINNNNNSNNNNNGGAAQDGSPTRSTYANNIDSSFASAQSQCLGMGAQSSMGGLGGNYNNNGANNSSYGMTNASFRQPPAALFTPRAAARPLSPASPVSPQNHTPGGGQFALE